MSLSPSFKSPFTDFFAGGTYGHQYGGRCADIEMSALDCLEAYGLPGGLRKCEALITDFQECALRRIENSRYVAMRTERERQYFMGERSKENRYAEAPKTDSY